jgi:undecaprenyl phosphate-alpha-L-ara4N flippase subunit ArnE
MSPLEALLLTATVAAIACGQVLFKVASSAWPEGSGLWGLAGVPWFWAAILVYGGATLAWLAVLRSVPLSVAYPFFALAFFIVPLLSWWLLGEAVGVWQWVGALLIAVGVWVSAR